jgi:hypothetical protein
MSEPISEFAPEDYVAQQLATIHDKRVFRYLEAGDVEGLKRRLRKLAWRRPSPLQRLLRIDNSVGATNVLMIIDWDGCTPSTIEVYIAMPPSTP